MAAACARADVPAGRASQPTAARRLPTAVARHVPEGCNAVVHVDFAGRGGRARLDLLLAETPQLAEVALAAGAIDVGKDVAGALACFRATAEGVSTTLVAGGAIPDHALVPFMAAAADSDVIVIPLAGREVAAFFVEGRRWFAGQATDGTIVLGDDAQMVGSALLPSDRGLSLSIPWDAPLAMSAEGAAIARAAKAGVASGEVGGALMDASRMMLVAGGGLSLRLTYADARRAAEVESPLREALDRRVGEGARVDARTEGADVVIDISPSPSTAGARDAFADLAITAVVGREDRSAGDPP